MSSNDNSLIQMKGIKKVFYTDEVETHALTNVHLTLQRGDYVSISGPSGCGKTTLLSILGLLDSPTEGQYVLNEQSVDGLGFADRARIRNREIGFIFQAFNLIGDLTVYENVELPLSYRGMGSGERKERVMEALERVSMSHRTKHYPSQLSGGQQQRVAVARASKNSESVMTLLDELHEQGATICMVTHDPRWARHANRNVSLFDGRIVAEEAIVDEPHEPVATGV
jgi:putative ABC transport system ATP-binding protein